MAIKTDHDDQERDTRRSPARVAVVQFDPQVGVENLASNAAAVQERLERAVAAGANLIVLPELATTGYSFSTRSEAFLADYQGRDLASTARLANGRSGREKVTASVASASP